MSTDLLRIDRGQKGDRLTDVANTTLMRANQKQLEALRFKGAVQSCVAVGSFVVFLALEGLLIYAYCVFLAAR